MQVASGGAVSDQVVVKSVPPLSTNSRLEPSALPATRLSSRPVSYTHLTLPTSDLV